MTSTDLILKFFKERVDHPTSARELARLLKVPREERVAFKRLLKTLVASGDIAQVRGNRFALPDAQDLIPGRLHANPAGFGFVMPDAAKPGERSDIYIPAANLTEAMHGDRVLVRIERQTPRGLEGRIVRILERAHDTVVGRFETDAAGLAYVLPFDKRITVDIHVPSGQSSSRSSATSTSPASTRRSSFASTTSRIRIPTSRSRRRGASDPRSTQRTSR